MELLGGMETKGKAMNVNFTVFIDKILSGEKRQTIRRASPKWGNVKAGDKLTLYTGLRTKACRKLGEAVVESITPIVLLPAEEDCETRTALWSIRPCAYDLKSMIFADGFESVDDFWKFFVEHYGSQPIEMNVIRWTDFKEAKDARGTIDGNGDNR